MLFAPYLIRQAGGSALPDHIQPVLKFYLFIRSQSGNVHRYSPLSGFRVFGVNPKNSNPDFTGERHIFHYTFLFDAYDYLIKFFLYFFTIDIFALYLTSTGQIGRKTMKQPQIEFLC